MTAARLLAGSGFACRVFGPAPAGGPTLLLNPGTCHLLGELWGLAPDDLPARHCLRYRAVHPPAPEPPALVEQHSLVIDSRGLADFLEMRLRDACPDVEVREDGDSANGWHLIASGRPLRDGERGTATTVERVGQARCAAAAVRLVPDVATDRAVFEALPEGWLFLMPIGEDRAILQAQQEAPEAHTDLITANLAGSAVVRRLVASRQEVPRSFEAMPRLTRPRAGSGWLAIGDAAMALPPVTGDGVGNGLRTAILATAVLRALRRGEPEDAVLAHYDRRLAEAFEKMARRTGYAGGTADDGRDAASYRLRGLDLVRIDRRPLGGTRSR